MEYLKQVLNIDPKKYFNAGVLLLNLEEQRKNNVCDKIMFFLQDKSPLEFQDQDAINAVFKDKIYELPAQWNVLKGYTKIKSKIYHFNGIDKPWRYHTQYDYKFPIAKTLVWWKFYANKNEMIFSPCFYHILLKQIRNNISIFLKNILTIKKINNNKYLVFFGIQFCLNKIKDR